MDFRATQEMEAVRAEVRSVLSSVLPADWQGSGLLPMDVLPEHMELARELDRALAARGLLAPSFPPEYGGRGMGPHAHYALLEELGYHLAPRLTTIAVDLVGPVLLLYGSEDQKRQHLPRIAREGTIWSQGFSEPQAGSDLTSLQTSARRRDGRYVINGQKIWTSMAHRAEWIILLARTGPPESRGRGLSLFLVPAAAPGITISPIVDMTGAHMLNQVFFEDVEVPVENLVGEENRGWVYATTLLQHERGDAVVIGQFRRLLDDLRALLQSRYGRGRVPASVRQALAQAEVELEVGRLLNLRVVDMAARGLPMDLEASVCKLFVSESFQRFTHVACAILGLWGLGTAGKGSVLGGRAPYYLMASVPTTIIAGTSEVQRLIIATRGLGLPRS
ncbi:MAG TPA: acyl-CoA dehydrogenase family protein [Dehalococcoidia bacterium]|nr:acyl-CoA dehydrogenase family protein [Dehalococcoidia bacterium]